MTVMVILLMVKMVVVVLAVSMLVTVLEIFMGVFGGGLRLVRRSD